MKKSILILNVLLLASCGSLVQAAPSAEEILDQHIQAIGGEAAHKKLETRHIEATMKMAAAGLTGSLEIFAKAPNKSLSIITIPNVGTISEGYDGNVAWTQNPFVGVVEKQGAQLEMAKRQADFYRDVEIKERYQSWEYGGTETVNSKKTHVLKGKNEDGNTETLFVGADDFLIHEMTMEIPTENGVMPAKMVLGDYREIDGIKVPYSIKMVEPAPAAFEMNFKRVEHQVKIDDSKFAKPAN